MSKISTLVAFLFICQINLNAQTPGNSLSFDGTNDHVTSNLPTLFNDIPNNDFTIETWVKPEGSGTQRVMFAQFDNTHFVSILLNATNEVYFYVYDGALNSVKAPSLTTTAWSHIAATWESGTQTLTLFVNGVELAPATGGSSSSATSNQMYLGATTNGDQNLIGELDEFRIWDYARNECEIAGAMNSEFTTIPTEMVVYYKFNPGTPGGNNAGITALSDYVLAYNGSLVNFALNGATSNWVASGAVINSVGQNGGSSGSALSDSICAGNTYSFGGMNLDSTGVYADTLTGIGGCDSIVTLTLGVTDIDNSATQSGNMMTATTTGASYQWVDCGNGNANISGATNQAYTATANGSYAVEITQNGCTETSPCMSVAGIGFDENTFGDGLLIYPNPTDGLITIDLTHSYDELTINILNIDGKLISTQGGAGQQLVTIDINGEAGIYFVELISADLKSVVKVTKR